MKRQPKHAFSKECPRPPAFSAALEALGLTQHHGKAVCPSFLSHSERCLPGAKQVHDEILKEQDAALRDWVTQVRIDEAIARFKPNIKSGAGACFRLPTIGKAMKLIAWFESLGADRCDRDPTIPRWDLQAARPDADDRAVAGRR